MRNIIIVGGGLSGLVAANILKNNGMDVLVIEKKNYPFHKVCGEYISNEAKPFLISQGLFPETVQAVDIDEFWLSSIGGKLAKAKLNSGGFGLSRYELDAYLYKKALDKNVEFILEDQVISIDFKNDEFEVELASGGTHRAKIVIGAYGKRSKIDKKLNRKFIKKKSPYVGVKYHIRYDHPDNVVALHNFEGGYCGINNVENGISNLCYLSQRTNLKIHGSIPAMEQHVLCKNPHLKKILSEAEILFENPEVINEISFETKKPVENHIIMCGDSAGMITPLCGNGMAMAVHSAKIASDLIQKYFSKKSYDRVSLEEEYSKIWNSNFRLRLHAGRSLQKLFGSLHFSSFTVHLMKASPFIAKQMIKQTHGKPF